jgi:hypothetical protein
MQKDSYMKRSISTIKIKIDAAENAPAIMASLSKENISSSLTPSLQKKKTPRKRTSSSVIQASDQMLSTQDSMTYILAPAPKPKVPPPPPPKYQNATIVAPIKLNIPKNEPTTPVISCTLKTTSGDEVVELFSKNLEWFVQNWSSESQEAKEEILEGLQKLISRQPAKLEVIESKKILQSQIANFEYDKVCYSFKQLKDIKPPLGIIIIIRKIRKKFISSIITKLDYLLHWDSN